MANVSEFVEPHVINLDELIGDKIKYGMIGASALLLMFTGLSLVALSRTRNTPPTARFLSAALLVFDVIPNFIYAVRKFIIHFRYSLAVQFIGVGFSFVAYINIAVMSFERLLIFQWPNFYLRRISFRAFRTFALCIWGMYLGAWAFGTGHCFFIYDSNFQIGNCVDVVIEKFIFLTCPLSVIVSCGCLAKIAVIIQKQTRKVKAKGRTIQNHKSTIVVYLCSLNYVLTTLIYIVIMFITVNDNLLRRILMDALMMFNGLLDTCVYVLWYKECRLELVRMFAKIFPSLNSRVEKMRVTVFDVLTFSNNAKQ